MPFILNGLLRVDGVDPKLQSEMFDKLVEWDAIPDERSPVVWTYLSAVEANKALLPRVREFMTKAKVADNAVKAFYWCASVVPEDRRAAEHKALLEEYMAHAWAHKDKAALLARIAEPRLTQYLRDEKIDITVTPDQFKLLKVWWNKEPKALEYLIVEDKPKAAP
jgi:hypothetical protein